MTMIIKTQVWQACKEETLMNGSTASGPQNGKPGQPVKKSFWQRLFSGNGRSAEEQTAGGKLLPLNKLMTSQLAALWLETKDRRYQDEFFRRIRMCGVSEDTVKRWFAFETEILERCPRPEMCSESFVSMPLLTLREKFLPREISWYAEHFDYPLSYVIRLSDEAEWHFWNSHEKNLPENVWTEIFELSDRSRKLFLPLAQYMVDRMGWSVEAVNKYSYNEQGMLDILRWRNGARRSAKTPWGMNI